MITCPSCKNKEIPGTLFCSQCGAQLVTISESDTQKMHAPKSREKNLPQSTTPILPPSSYASLHLVESGQILPLTERREFSLGRVAEGQPIMPDIDLTPYKAYENGVSRLHALLKILQDHVAILDLGSSNGTYVNGKRLTPSVEHPLRNGDMIYLGKLKIQVLFNPKDK
jgi:hypothetical protein